MGTQKDPNAKKASPSRSARYRITTKPGDTTRASRLRLAPLTNPRKPGPALRPTKSSFFPHSTATTEPFRAAGPWQAWEEDLVISLRKTGKTYAEISQQLPGRSSVACHRRMNDKKKSQIQDCSPQQEGRFAGNKNGKRKGWKKVFWQPWELELMASLRETGKTYREISHQLSGRSAVSCQIKMQEVLNSRMQSASSQGNEDDLGIKESDKVWGDWEDQVIIHNHNAGKDDWTEISKLLPSRTEMAAKGRWENYLNIQPHRKYKWRQWEDHLLVSLHTSEKTWSEIAQMFPNRSQLACERHWTMPTQRHSELTKGRRGPWTKLERETLVSLVNAIGPRWHQIAQELPGRPEKACKHFYIKISGEETVTRGPSREDWRRHWDNASSPEESEIEFMKIGLADNDATEEVDVNAGESTSAPVAVAPTLKRNQAKSFNAKKRQAIHVPIV